MRILMVCNGAYPDEIGGAHTYVYELARHLAQLGHYTSILTRRNSPDLPMEETIDGIRYLRYPYHDTGDPVRWRCLLRAGARAGFDAMADQSFDVIHGHWPHSSSGVFNHWRARSALRVYTFHSPSFEEEQVEAEVLRRNEKRGLRHCMKRLWVPLSIREKHSCEQRVLKRAGMVFVLSRYMQGRLLDSFNVPADRIRVVPGGVDTERFCPADDRPAIRERLGLAPDKQVLLTVRRLVPRMGLKTLVEAMPAVLQQHPGTVLCIGGAGPLRADLLRQVHEMGLENSVRLLGLISAENLPDWYRAADYFIMPSEYLEGFGLATLEAMACGTPTLGTAVGGTAELLTGIDTSLLFNGSAASHLADGIVFHLANQTAARLRERLVRHARKVYAWSTIAPWIASLLQEELDGLRRRQGRPPAVVMPGAGR